MKKWVKQQRVLFLFMLFFLISGFGIAALVENSSQVYSALDKAFYLSAEDAIWIRPGLHIEIQDVNIPADRKATVTFRISDDKGFGLDREGNLSPGPVSTSFLFAYIPQSASQYVSYYTRLATSNINGSKAIQATTGSGTYVSKGDGVYTFTFSSAIPADYDASATHTIGIYARRDLTEFGLERPVDNATVDFVPNGGEVNKVRQVVNTVNCNECHNPLALHGGSRTDVEICILCHTPQTTDPDTGNTVDMKVMTHKIHMGELLPSVEAGIPYIIIGHNDSVHDYSTVAFPQDLRNCTTCHKDASQANNWFLEPTRDTCQSCHDDIDWATGAHHPGGPQSNDNRCSSCHYPQGDYEYDASIMGAHIPPYKSNQLKRPSFRLISIANTGPGQKPVVRFQVVDKNGSIIDPSTMARLGFNIGGPTSDYRSYFSENGLSATPGADSIWTYTFSNAIPADAKGSYSFEAEGYVNTTLNPGNAAKEEVYRDAIDNVVKSFAVTGTTVTERRVRVDLAKCNKCHDKLQLHGNNRNKIEACVICHNPANTDAARRPASANPPEAIDFKILAHKIHTGEELEGDYTVYGFNGTEHDFAEVRFPGDRRDCLQCHTAGAYTVPLASTVTSSTTPRNYWDPTRPTAAACLGCHDGIAAAAHAILNTASFGESCAVCHKESAEFAVSKVHAR